MKVPLLAGVGLIALGDGDAGVRPLIYPAVYTKATAPVLAPMYDWSGFYIGANGGYGWGQESRNCWGVVPRSWRGDSSPMAAGSKVPGWPPRWPGWLPLASGIVRLFSVWKLRAIGRT